MKRLAHFLPPARGYSVTTATDGKVLKQTKQVKAGDVLTTRLSDGWVESEVKGVMPVKPRARKRRNQRWLSGVTASISETCLKNRQRSHCAR